MNVVWSLAAFITFSVSAFFIICTILEIAAGKKHVLTFEFWTAILFHAVSALLALWFFLKALEAWHF